MFTIDGSAPPQQEHQQRNLRRQRGGQQHTRAGVAHSEYTAKMKELEEQLIKQVHSYHADLRALFEDHTAALRAMERDERDALRSRCRFRRRSLPPSL